MTKEVLEMLIKAVAMLISVLITAVIVPWIKSNISEQKLKKIEEYAEIAVRCAEQIYTVEEWKAKKNYACEYVASKVADMGLDMSVEDINALIESTVNLIKYGSEYTK